MGKYFITGGAAVFTRYASFIKEVGLRKLLDANETVFLGGNITIQNHLWPLFDKVFGLVLPPTTHEKRLANRINNSIGNNDQDRAYLLSVNDHIESQLKTMDAIIISSDQPTEKVVDEILGYVNEA